MNGRFCLLAVVVPLLVLGCGPRTPDALLADARAAFAAGEARTAEIHLKNLLQQQSDNVEARALLGRVCLAIGDPAGAEHNLRTALTLGGEPELLQLPLLEALLRQGKYRDVLDRFAEGPPLSGAERVAALNIAGTAHRAMDEIAEAEAAFEQALDLEPESAVARTELASLYFSTGRTTEARELAASVAADQPNFAPALLLNGAIEASGGRFDAAEEWVSKALEVESTRRNEAQYARALSQLVEIQLAQRKIADAAANADKLLNLAPKLPAAQYLRARVQMEQSDMDGAERRLEALIADAPDYWPAYVSLGLINTNQSQLGQAEMYLRRAATINPNDARTQLILAELYMRQSNLADAQKVLDESPASGNGLFLALAGRASLEAGQPDLAARYFERSEKAPPATIRELVDLSSVYVAAGELDRAVRLLETAALEGPDNERLATYILALVQMRRGDLTAAAATAARLTEQRPEALNLRGTIALLSKDVAQARLMYEQALEQEPKYVPVLLNMAKVEFAQNDKEAAAEYLHRVLQIDEAQINALFGLVQLAAERGDFAEAATWLSRVPESALRFRVEGEIHAAQQHWEQAAAAFGKAFAAGPSSDLALKTYAAARQAGHADADSVLLEWSTQSPRDVAANFALGTLALERGDSSEAIARYETVLEESPEHFAALNNLAWVYSERGDPRALSLAERAYAVQPENPSVADTLGWLRVRNGDAAAGRPLLEQAARGNAPDPEIRYHWAVALAETGDSARAIEVLEALLREAPEFTSRGAAEARLVQLRGNSTR